MATQDEWVKEIASVYHEKVRPSEPIWISPLCAAIAQLVLDEWMMAWSSVENDVAPAVLNRPLETSSTKADEIHWGGLVKRCKDMRTVTQGVDDIRVAFGIALLCAARLGRVDVKINLKDAKPPRCVEFPEAVREAAKLALKTPIFDERRPRTRTRMSPIPPARFEVQVPRYAPDHRQLIVGLLPNPQLHPHVFVSPDDGTDRWFSQADPISLKYDRRAFAAMVYFGNPGLVAPERPPRYKVRVVALRDRWRPKSPSGSVFDRLSVVTESELDALARQEGAVKWPPNGSHEVERLAPPITRLTVSCPNRQDWAEVNVGCPMILECPAPVRLSWQGARDLHVELRFAEDDRLVAEETASGIVLALDEQTAGPGSVMRLNQLGMHRVKMYPAGREPKIDPLVEVWINILDPAASSLRSNA